MSKWWDRKKSAVIPSRVEREVGLPETIKDWEIEKGGYRYDEDGKDYFLTWPQLLLYEKKNLVVVDDEEFYKWFKEFRISEKVWDRSASVARTYTRSWDDGEYTEKPKDKWLSSWWAKDVYKGFSTSDGKKNKLALVMSAVRTTIRVIDDTVPPMSVHWATDEHPMSYTDFRKQKIVINPAPVQDGAIEDGEAVDITTGFALHEAAHSQYSREPYRTISEPEMLRPIQTASMLLNFVEDIRIEAAVAEEFPGFAGYFEKSLSWAWDASKAHIPKTWGPTLREKMNGILCIVRFPEGPATLTDPSYAPEIPWWLNWRDEYLSGKVDARTTIQRGLDRLAEDEATKEEMDKMAEAEKEMEEKMGDIKALIDKLLSEGLEKLIDMMGVDGPVPEGDRISDADMGEIEILLSEELQQEKIFIKTSNGRGNPPIWVRHPLETEESRRKYIGKPNPVLARLKSALVFRQELPRYTNRLLKSGNLDEEELWRWQDRDYRVFNEDVIAARPQVQLSLLVDMSGSMYGTKLHSAQELAQLMIWAVKDMEGVDTKVFGHTGDVRAIGVELYRLWEQGESMTRLGLINSMDHSQNYDGHAIAWCVKELLGRGFVEEQRIMFVLSDGYPAAHDYGGSEGEAHVRQVTTWAESQGVHVIQIAIDPSIDPSRQARMFKEFVQFTSLNDVPKQLTRLLAKYT